MSWLGPSPFLLRVSGGDPQTVLGRSTRAASRRSAPTSRAYRPYGGSAGSANPPSPSGGRLHRPAPPRCRYSVAPCRVAADWPRSSENPNRLRHVAVRDQGLAWRTTLITAILLLVVVLPRTSSAGHCSLSALTGNGPVTLLNQLVSRPNIELQCNMFNARSNAEGQPATAPGFNPFRLLAFEQQLTSHITLAGDSPLCSPLDVSKGGNLVSLANCTDRMILSSLQPGQITGNPFGMLVSFPGEAGQRGGIQPDEGGTKLFSNQTQPLQSMIIPTLASAFDTNTDNNAGSFTVNPSLTVGVLLSVANTTLLPDRLGSLRTVQTTPAGLKSFGMTFGDDFAFNTGPGNLRRPGRGATLAAGSAYLELASAFCPAPAAGRATVCHRLTVFEEIEGAVGDETITFGAGDTSLMFFTLQSFHTSITQSDGLNTFDKPVVFWRQRVDEGLFVLDTLGSFMYNDGGQNPLIFHNTTYPTGGSITNAMHGFSDLQTATTRLPGGLSSFANLVSVENGVCIPGGFGGDNNVPTVTNCPQTP